MASNSKRKMTFAKIQREQAVREKRARKQSERLARKQEKRDIRDGVLPDPATLSLDGEPIEGELDEAQSEGPADTDAATEAAPAGAGA